MAFQVLETFHKVSDKGIAIVILFVILVSLMILAWIIKQALVAWADNCRESRQHQTVHLQAIEDLGELIKTMLTAHAEAEKRAQSRFELTIRAASKSLQQVSRRVGRVEDTIEDIEERQKFFQVAVRAILRSLKASEEATKNLTTQSEQLDEEIRKELAQSAKFRKEALEQLRFLATQFAPKKEGST